MNRVALMPDEKRYELFSVTAERRGMRSGAIAEKDFWVTWVLGRLFTSPLLRTRILFKGGTSLSKVFGLIERFSEDIDLILDWNEVVTEDPNFVRSKTKQDQFNKAMPALSRQYIKHVFLPEVVRLMKGICTAAVEEGAADVINIRYPSGFADAYLRPEIRLEIGPLAQWIPNAWYPVVPYAAEAFPDLFTEPSCEVRAIKAERTFWEKATILHQEAHRPEGSPFPARYSRHYYDLSMMAADQNVRQQALDARDLLDSVVAFKTKFYPRGWARYDLAKVGTLQLMPPELNMGALRSDYAAMREMVFGRYPDFEEVMAALKSLQAEINGLLTPDP
jgi:hypothetical protein